MSAINGLFLNINNIIDDKYVILVALIIKNYSLSSFNEKTI